MTTISFSTLRNLQCPFRYSVYLANSRQYNKHKRAIQGTQIHAIYQKHIQMRARQFEKHKYSPDIQLHLHDDFLRWIHDLSLTGYEVFTEHTYIVDLTPYEILGIEYLYAKPDIVLMNNDKLRVIEIKTGSASNCRYQLQLYGWAIMQIFPHLQKFEGIRYVTYTDSDSVETFMYRDQLLQLIEYQLKLISECFALYNINSLAELAALGKHIQQYISVTDCHTCFIRKECPIVNPSANITIPWDDKLVAVNYAQTLISNMLCTARS